MDEKKTVQIGEMEVVVEGIYSKESIQSVGETKVFNELKETNSDKIAELMKAEDFEGIAEFYAQLKNDAKKAVADAVKDRLSSLTKYVIVDGSLYEFKGGTSSSGGTKSTPTWVREGMIVWYKGVANGLHNGGLFEVTDNLKCRSLRTNEVKGASKIANELTGRDGNSGFYREHHWEVVNLKKVSNAVKVELELAKSKGFFDKEYVEAN
jgi:hypothetical protein